MSLPRHAKYIESGVEWLGEIPSHWAVKRLRFVAELNPSKSEVSHLPADTDVSFLPMEAIGDDGSLELDRVRPLADVQTGYTFFRDGDVTIAKITPCFENGKGAAMRDLCNGIGFGTTELIVARPKATQTTSSYLQWLFTSRPFRKAGEAFMYGAGGQKRVPDDFVRDFAIGFPPLTEQRHIVTFLDRETTKIDALVEEQRRLIELLKEKRQAVISQAVTKGLNPSVPMKDSGVEWLGKVPAHWKVKRLKHVSPQVTVGIVVEPSKHYADSGVPALRSLNVRQDEIEPSGMVYITKEGHGLHGKSQLKVGDLVAVRSGQPGTTAVVPAEFDGCNCIDLLVIRRPEAGCSEFLCRFMNSDAARIQYSQGSGGAIQQHFNVEAAGNLVLAWPPLDEQTRIADAVKRQVAAFDDLIDDATSGMRLLGERRSALISAAVTGKIDVRGLAPQPEGAAA